MQKIVKYNDGSIKPEDIKTTTYQMDNFYDELSNGKVSGLNTFNFLQHFKIAKMIPEGSVVLDVCAGRCLMLPFLINHSKIKKYIAVDIEAENLANRVGPVPLNADFQTQFIVSNVAEMSKAINHDEVIDFIIYTSAIEHMCWEDQKKSLQECSKLLKPGGTMILSGPYRPDPDDEYRVRYKAHLREPTRTEIRKLFTVNNLDVYHEYGIWGDKVDLSKIHVDERLFWFSMIDYLPEEYVRSIFYIDHPELATEYFYILKKRII